MNIKLCATASASIYWAYCKSERNTEYTKKHEHSFVAFCVVLVTLLVWVNHFDLFAFSPPTSDCAREVILWGASLISGSSPNECSWGCKFSACVSVVTNLEWALCHKLDDVSASLMRSRHLISNTKDTVGLRVMFPSVKPSHNGKSLRLSGCRVCNHNRSKQSAKLAFDC